jgi:hypothetical protein
MEPERFITMFSKAKCLSLNWASPWLPNVVKIHFNIILSFMCISSRWFPSFTLPNQNPACILFYPTSATHPTHLIILDLITLINMGGTKVTCHYRQQVKHVVSIEICSTLYLARCTNCVAVHNAISSNLPLHPFTQMQVPFSTLHSPTSAA